jgi:hypothetical protein
MSVERITLSRKKGWRKPPDAVVVSRPTKWGNPFALGLLIPPREAARYYDEWLDGVAYRKIEPERRRWILAHVHELRGKRLACWCKPGVPCHADVLMELANKEPQP